METVSAPERLGVPFVHSLADFGDRIAVVTPSGSLTYRALASRVASVGEVLGSTRRLVLVAAGNDLDSVVTYLAALRGGHPVLLTSPDGKQLDTLVDAYDPDVVQLGGELRERRAGTAHELHSDLALLLSTSGSTGSPKLVRLSASNLQSNATSIAEYLDIRDTDRAALTLPLHYCYGLSVLNSNLSRGAAVLLSDLSVVDPEFWSMFQGHGGTSLHGVPYTFDLLDRAGFADRDLPALRYVTQAGGRLAPTQVRRYAGLASAGGWRFFVMYGQTEATARMAYLPAELAVTRPEAVGIPIPGGSFEIHPDGELVYRGPNVMLGYARGPADLALGATLGDLPTGDLARRAADGLYEVIGRKSRFVKLFGLRVDLDEIERHLTRAGFTAAAAGDDTAITLAMVNGQDTHAAATLVATRVGLPVDHVRVREYAEFPRLATGKVDYAGIQSCPQAPPNQDHPSAGPDRLAKGRPPGDGWGLRALRFGARVPRRFGFPGQGGRSETRIVDGSASSPTSVSPRGSASSSGSLFSRGSSAGSVRQIFQRALNVGDIPDDATFVSLGGDSLTYVRASIDLERLLGEVPAAWHTIPVAELERAGPKRGRLRSLETNILLRALAITLIVSTHVGLTQVWGGAHLLLVIAGWSFARFALAPVAPERMASRIAKAAARIAVPSAIFLTWRAAVSDNVAVTNALLVNNFIQHGTISYWYVEVLVQILAALALLFLIPGVRRAAVEHGFALAAGVLAITLIARMSAVHVPMSSGYSARDMSIHGVLWLFVLGWLVQRATTLPQRAAAAAMALVLIPGWFDDPVRDAIVIAGVLLVLFVPTVRVPGAVVRVAGLVAGASLYIYLTHYIVFMQLRPLLPLWVVVAITVAVGVIVWRAVCALGKLRARLA
ncbi:Long-chain-fatty-acid--CoA ligase [Alloactinosynnema sp. L-07]|uniref:non-ribosomal peptide synthetase n=1 Tax=Alloactinosynnema sp. L-07 TaxID=1653480 RepID=UPI00065EF853|nr:non-ribosomal peptide synthetase [Alloactinosynnema sp. L-07]CRK57101.1 Long-chain-fatty-acid--CoA ligase [Alloactinosynnema sp. L-07]